MPLVRLDLAEFVGDRLVDEAIDVVVADVRPLELQHDAVRNHVSSRTATVQREKRVFSDRIEIGEPPRPDAPQRLLRHLINDERATNDPAGSRFDARTRNSLGGARDQRKARRIRPIKPFCSRRKLLRIAPQAE